MHLTLKQWEEKHGRQAVVVSWGCSLDEGRQPHTARCVVANGLGVEAYSELYSLSDYAVSSQAAGACWLVNRGTRNVY